MTRLIIALSALAFSPALAAQNTESEGRTIFRAWELLDATGQGPADDPDILWAQKYAHNGTDVTRDGRIWANLAPTGDEDDFSMLIEDIRKATQYYSTVWIRGHHKNNPKVRYRTSMTRYVFGCTSQTFAQIHYAGYGADGKVIDSDEARHRERTIVPGTVAETWWKYACNKLERVPDFSEP